MSALLWNWTPFLFQGFVWNIAITAVAMTLGSLLGVLCVALGLSGRSFLMRLGTAIPAFFRAVPTLVLLFYLATLVPNQISLGLINLAVPAWLKAAIALSASPMGFTALNLRSSILSWRAGDLAAAMLFIPNWMSSFLITLLASSTASLVGVSELVGRCSAVIQASGSGAMLPVYFYGSLFFFLFCTLTNLALRHLKRRIRVRLSSPAAASH